MEQKEEIISGDSKEEEKQFTDNSDLLINNWKKYVCRNEVLVL